MRPQPAVVHQPASRSKVTLLGQGQRPSQNITFLLAWSGRVWYNQSCTWIAKYSKKSYETQVKYIPRKNHRTFILMGVQNGCAFSGQSAFNYLTMVLPGVAIIWIPWFLGE